MYYDSLAVFGCYLSSGVAVAITFLTVVLIALRLGPKSSKEISSRHVERLQFLTMVVFFSIIFQLLVTAIYCANSANRMIFGLLAEKIHVTDALVTRLSHIVRMGLFGIWTTVILSLVNLSLIIFLRRKRVRRNRLLSGSSTELRSNAL